MNPQPATELAATLLGRKQGRRVEEIYCPLPVPCFDDEKQTHTQRALGSNPVSATY